MLQPHIFFMSHRKVGAHWSNGWKVEENGLTANRRDISSSPREETFLKLGYNDGYNSEYINNYSTIYVSLVDFLTYELFVNWAFVSESHNQKQVCLDYSQNIDNRFSFRKR